MRNAFSSKIGFIMASAGAAVGLGNIWRFPTVVAENGGGSFVLLYACCILLIGVPVMLIEIAIGRMTQKSTVGAFKTLQARGIFKLLPYVMLSIPFFVLSFYAVIAGWIIAYLGNLIINSSLGFEKILGDVNYTIPAFLIFIVLSILIVSKEIANGIERASKWMMPLLFLLMLVLLIYVLLLPNAEQGVAYYLHFDWEKINASTVLAALGQAFFSLTLGVGVMITYGSYLQKKSNIISSTLWIGSMDLLVALLAGLIIFPAVFAFEKTPTGANTLIFEILPDIFQSMIGGYFIGILFYLLLLLAALTSSISMLEVLVAYWVDEKNVSRKKVTWIIGILVSIIGIPSALSTGANDFFTQIGFNFLGKKLVGFIDILSFVFGSFLLIVTSFLTCIFIFWNQKMKAILTELNQGSNHFFDKKIIFSITWGEVLSCLIQFILPLIMLLILLQLFNLI